ncbi:MAG: DUF1611 domain-containing protein [Flavobacteriaceae bacterium]|jgi:uncharacterized NAD-dependent epimerase/dehydratase family protein
MLESHQKVALYMEGFLHSDYGKMGLGVVRFLENPIVGIIDTEHAGSNINREHPIERDIPIFEKLDQVIDRGAEVLLLGIAPSGGKIPDEWIPLIKHALNCGLSLINGLHDTLENKFADLIKRPDQWIWDVRMPQFIPQIASGHASKLSNKRLLMIGTDMACGKMTAGLEIYRWAKENDINSGFVATGQIGITIMGGGIPLDAMKVDHACGAVEQMVLNQKDRSLVVIEGQGSLLHPGSTATLPLMRGSCPTHMILCHRADKITLRNPESIKIPPLKDFIDLNESLASAVGTFGSPKVMGVALNTSRLSEKDSLRYIGRLERELNIPVTDVVRYGVNKIVEGWATDYLQ